MSESRKAPDRKVLQEALSRALLAAGAAGAASPAEMRSLIEVARRHRNRPFELEPVAVELVEAMLRSHFADWTDSREAWRRMALEIARTLEDDPAIRERLERLWAGILEAAR